MSAIAICDGAMRNAYKFYVRELEARNQIPLEYDEFKSTYGEDLVPLLQENEGAL